MIIRRLSPSDANSFQALRLAGLRDTPSAFGSSYEEEKDFSASVIEGRLAPRNDQGPFGAFEQEVLVGLVALGRERMNKLAHKGLIWGMYVKPESRGKGVARALLTEALSLARSVPELKQVNLSVNASNTGAIKLYESFGFKAFGLEPGALLVNGELQEEIHMYLRLADASQVGRAK
jgi:RimJ/RimL family protein N-acetyltransferase